LVSLPGMESPGRRTVDTNRSCRYRQKWNLMATQRIKIGQVWKKVGTEETFLVTKLYNEALATIAVLRPTSAAEESMIRVRVERQGNIQTLPGFSMAQEAEGT
jgi:hypothetical protein